MVIAAIRPVPPATIKNCIVSMARRALCALTLSAAIAGAMLRRARLLHILPHATPYLTPHVTYFVRQTNIRSGKMRKLPDGQFRHMPAGFTESFTPSVPWCNVHEPLRTLE
ncbi:hypothetical protein [Pseudoduganella dura]|uniref:hypothetical protein n=1 Tax=Pseudoduganella dura TaxID=321982 RepID=UPI0015639A1E|nr:hypothetical protein [Pseudoduganella dura]GGX78658.1 hypothetical protein GCM10007386_07080 [Pseudoduganella dura]